jgi:putative restriction endonuclease
MYGYVGITDFQWFSFLSSQRGIDEVNFWQPGGNRRFTALNKGELFLFKLHNPRNYIVGGGFFTHSNIFPTSLAWEAFGIKNGAATIEEMRSRIERLRRQTKSLKEDYNIGCIILTQPFFFLENQWIKTPDDWKPGIQQGKKYDFTKDHGKVLNKEVSDRLSLNSDSNVYKAAEEKDKYGRPVSVLPRLGQGGFRVLVTDAYQRQCTITGEKVLPALETAHIRPYAENGTHEPNNGLLLRRDFHTLLDRGYLTITPKYFVEVSKRIKEEFHNGREYNAYHGKKINLPLQTQYLPSPENLSWHNESKYLG